MVLINHIQNTLFKEEKSVANVQRTSSKTFFFFTLFLCLVLKLINSQLTGKSAPKNSHTLTVLDHKGSLNYKPKETYLPNHI